MGVVALDQVGVVAIHRPHEPSEGTDHAGRQAPAEARRRGRQVDRKVAQRRPMGGSFRQEHRLHLGRALAVIHDL